MSKFTFKAMVAEGDLTTAKLGTGTVAASGDLNGNDIGKPVKLTAADTYGLCSNGDQIDGFLYSVESYTADGYAVGTVQLSGRRRVELGGNSAVGTLVQSGTNAARTVAPTNGLGVVVEHTHVTATRKLWRVISGTGLSGDTTCIIEKQ